MEPEKGPGFIDQHYQDQDCQSDRDGRKDKEQLSGQLVAAATRNRGRPVFTALPEMLGFCLAHFTLASAWASRSGVSWTKPASGTNFCPSVSSQTMNAWVKPEGFPFVT